MRQSLDDSPTTPRHPIRIVAERTGITPATLRAWERRHRAIAPRRSAGSQRLYSDADIERLRLIGLLAEQGYALADLARRGTPALTRLLEQQSGTAPAATPADDGTSRFNADTAVVRLLAETRALDATALRGTLTRAVFEIGPIAALDLVVSPFLRQVGDQWACGTVSIAEEHLASTAVRDVLGWLLQNAAYDRTAPTVVASTPPGEQHEFGAMMAAAVAAVAGWRVIYLGPNTPAAELVRIAQTTHARALLLCIAHHGLAGPEVREELAGLRAGLGARPRIIVGGAGTDDHRLTLRRADIDLVSSRTELRALLDTLWAREA